MKFSKKTQPLLRQIVLYALVAAVPLCLIFVSSAYNRAALQQEIFSTNSASVELVRTSVDLTFRELQDTLTVTGTNQNLTRYKLLTEAITASTTIADLISPHTALADMVLYVRDTEQFCSSSGVFTADTLLSQHFARDYSSGNTLENWLDTMQNVTASFYWAGSGATPTNYIYLFTPIYHLFQSNGVIAQRTACLMIRQSFVQDIFRSSQTSSEEGMLLLSPSGALLTNLTSRATAGYVTEVCDYIRNHPDICNTGYGELPGSDLMLFVSRSSDTGLIYVRFLPKSIAFSSLDIQFVLCIVFLVLAVILGAVLIGTNTRRGCRPAFRLVHWLQGSAPAEAAPPEPAADPQRAQWMEELLSSGLSYDLAQLDTAVAERNKDMATAVVQRLRGAAKLGDDCAAARQICQEISRHIQLPEAQEPADPDSIDSLFDSLTARLTALLSVPVRQEPLNQTDIGVKLLEYIDAHCLAYDFQLKNMAEHFAISPQYMRKLFKAHTGLSLSEYVSNKRLEKATYLLSETNLSLQDIVAQIGNSDISGFVRFFKQRTGMTPGQFRKARKEQEPVL